MYIETAGITVRELAAAGAELLMVAADATASAPHLSASLERRVEALNALQTDRRLAQRLSGDVRNELAAAGAALVGALPTLADDAYLDSDFTDEVSWYCRQVATFLPGREVTA